MLSLLLLLLRMTMGGMRLAGGTLQTWYDLTMPDKGLILVPIPFVGPGPLCAGGAHDSVALLMAS